MTDCKHIISFDDLTQYLKYGQANTPFVEETELQSNGDGWAVRVPCAKCHEEFDVDLIIHCASMTNAEKIFGKEQTYGTQGNFFGEKLNEKPVYDFSESRPTGWDCHANPRYHFAAVDDAGPDCGLLR